MDILKKFLNRKYLLIETFLLLSAFIYYLFFANKGIDLFDEGYYVHLSERIFHGEIPYKDFALQYTPGYFYLLAFLYKIFGPSILVGRLLSLFVCMLILCFTFLIINKLKLTSVKSIFLSFLGIVSFGYPLLNIPIAVWPVVLMSLVIVLAFIYWLDSSNQKGWIYIFIIGIALAFSLILRQNLGITFIIMCNFLLFFGKKMSISQKMVNFFIVNITWLLFTFCWVYYFFLRDNLNGLIEFISFSKKFSTEFGFTYLPFSFILKPFGIFKMLPYYLPIIFLFFLISYIFSRNKNWKIIVLCSISLVGFFTYIYPNSELLHVYPFWGMLIFSIVIFFLEKKEKYIAFSVICLMIGIGFYLTFFSGYYRYHQPYKLQNTQISLPKTQGILTERTTAENLVSLSRFINKNTSKKDYIFSYPYYPMLYFILDRLNPSKDSIYAMRLWHQYDDKIILGEIKQKKVKYIVTAYGYTFDSDISRFIVKQKEVFKNESFKVFEINY